MTNAMRLYRRLREAPFPSLGKRVGHFPLWDSIIAGYASRLADGDAMDDLAASEVTADDETLKVVAGLRAKESHTAEEQAFLDYYALLEEIRLAIVAAARKRT